MNNLFISLKKFFTNKITVTIIGVVAILIILYFMYTKTIEKQTDKKLVPVAAKELHAKDEITAEDITTVQVAAAAMPANVEKNSGNIEGKYVCYGTMIPEGSMFYSQQICNYEDLPGSWIKSLKPDANGVMPIPYSFPVNVTTTYGNSILPGDYVDFWAKTILETTDTKTGDSTKGLIYSKVFENAQVLSVTDSDGRDVFRSKDDVGEPAFLNFGLTPDHYRFFKYMENVEEQAVTIIVVPHGGEPTDEGTKASFVSATKFRALIEKFVSPAYVIDTPETTATTTTSNQAA